MIIMDKKFKKYKYIFLKYESINMYLFSEFNPLKAS